MDRVRAHSNVTGIGGFVAAIAVLVVLAAAASSHAAPNLTKQEWKKQADALCAAVIAKNHKYNPLYPAAKAAAVGDRVIAVSRRTMRSIRASQPPAAEKADRQGAHRCPRVRAAGVRALVRETTEGGRR